LKANNDVRIKVIKPVPFPVVEITLSLIYEPKNLSDDSRITLAPTMIVGKYAGIPILQSIIDFSNIEPYYYSQHAWVAMLSMEALAFVEESRQDDATISVELSGFYKETVPKTASQGDEYQAVDSFFLPIQRKFSQKEWASFLSEVGYGKKWIVELDSPKISGFEDVQSHLEKAWTDIYVAHAPDDAMVDLRTAWNSFEPIWKERGEKVKQEINEGSRSEQGYPNKGERVDAVKEELEKYIDCLSELQEKVKNITNIGPHKEVYAVSMEDALLGYRLTMSLMSYLSKFLEKAKK